MTRVIDLCAITQRSEMRQPNIHPNTLGRNRQGFGGDLNSNAGVPLAAFPLNRNGFGCASDRTMQLDLDCAGFRQDEPFAELESGLTKRHGVKAVYWPEAWKAWRLSVLTTPKEGSERFIKTAQRIFQHLTVNAGNVLPIGAHLSHLGGLPEEAYGYALSFPRFASFLKRGVIQLATNAKVGLQCLALRVRRIQAVSIVFPQHLPLYFTAILLKQEGSPR